MFGRKDRRPAVEVPGAALDDLGGVSQEQKTIERTEYETSQYLTGSKLYVVLGGLGLAIYLFALDIAVISTVSPGPLPLCDCCHN